MENASAWHVLKPSMCVIMSYLILQVENCAPADNSQWSVDQQMNCCFQPNGHWHLTDMTDQSPSPKWLLSCMNNKHKSYPLVAKFNVHLLIIWCSLLCNEMGHMKKEKEKRWNEIPLRMLDECTALKNHR